MLLVLIRNLRSAGRQYLREPLMVSIAILSLGIAMGAGTYLFGFVNLMLLTLPSGLQQPEELVDVGRTMRGLGFDTSGSAARSVIAASSAQIAGSGSRFRSVMVSAQVAFTLLLLVLAGLFTAAVQRAGDVDLGYDIENLHVAALDLRSSRYAAEDRHRIVRDVVESLRQQGQVASAAAGDVVPLTFSKKGFGGFLFDNGEYLGARDRWDRRSGRLAGRMVAPAWRSCSLPLPCWPAPFRRSARRAWIR